MEKRFRNKIIIIIMSSWVFSCFKVDDLWIPTNHMGLKGLIQLSCLPRVKYFGLSIPVTLPVYRNVNDVVSSLGIGLRGMYISSVSSE